MGKGFNEFTQEEKDEMVNLHNQGMLNRELADMFHTSKTMIARLLWSLNIESRHPWLTEERKQEIINCYLEYKNISKVEKIMKCCSSTVSALLDEYKIPKCSQSEVRRKYEIDEDYFEVIDTPNKAYSLGLIYSDGNVSKNGTQFSISLQARDRDVLDKLNAEFGGNRPLQFLELSKKNINWQDQYVLCIACKKNEC